MLSDEQLNEKLNLLLKCFERYYDITVPASEPYFSAHGEFHSHNEQYMLVKSAKIADIDCHEYLYFFNAQNLDNPKLNLLADMAWTAGQKKIKPFYGHKSSDITLIILADTIDSDTKKLIEKTKRYISYKFTMYGWSHFKLAAKEFSSGRTFSNRMGSDLKKILAKI